MDKRVIAYEEYIKSSYLGYTFAVQNAGIDLSKQAPRWAASKLHKYLCELVEEFLWEKTGNPYDILLISCPPQVGKSVSITETLPSYYLGHRQEDKVIEISYNESFARRFGKANKSKVKEFGGLFGISLSANSKSNVDWTLSNERGRMISRGVSSGVTGESCNLMIIDDPIKNSSDANSETMRSGLYREWLTSFRTRLAVGAKVILIQTRWHEDDLYGKLLNEKYARSVNLEAICDSPDDPLGRDIGEGICPEIGKGTEWLLANKEGMSKGEVDEGGETGSRAWEALYQGRPSAKEGNLIKREWWQFYDELPVLDTQIISVDAAFKSGKDNDYVALQVWGKALQKIYLIEAIKEHLDFVSTIKMIKMLKAYYPKTSQILIEDKANGPAIINSLRSEIMGIIGVTPNGGKISRVNGVTGVIEGGNVYLPRESAFTGWFIEECAAFPNGKHDDSVDSMSQALSKLMYMHHSEKPKAKPLSLDEIAYVKTSRKPMLGKGERVYVV